MSPESRSSKRYADGWITERKGTEVPVFLKLAYIVIACALRRLLLHLHVRRSQPCRTRAAGAASSMPPPKPPARLMYAVAALVVIFGIIVVVFAFAQARTNGPRPCRTASDQVQPPDATEYWMEMVKCRARLPGAYRRLRLRDRHRRGPLRRRLSHRARHQPVRIHLRTRLRRALRDANCRRGVGRCRRSPSAPSSVSSPTSSAPKPATSRLHRDGCNRRACCRPAAAITNASP